MIRSIAPGVTAQIAFERGAAEVVQWFTDNTSRQQIDEAHDALLDRLVRAAH